MTHNAKTCIERPRKIGAKFTGKNFGRDEIIQQVELSYEGKRDRWNGYNPSNYKAVIQDYEALESERLKRKEMTKQEKLNAKKIKKEAKRAAGEESSDSLSSSSEDSFVDGGEADPLNS